MYNNTLPKLLFLEIEKKNFNSRKLLFLYFYKIKNKTFLNYNNEPNN